MSNRLGVHTLESSFDLRRIFFHPNGFNVTHHFSSSLEPFVPPEHLCDRCFRIDLKWHKGKQNESSKKMYTGKQNESSKKKRKKKSERETVELFEGPFTCVLIRVPLQCIGIEKSPDFLGRLYPNVLCHPWRSPHLHKAHPNGKTGTQWIAFRNIPLNLHYAQDLEARPASHPLRFIFLQSVNQVFRS